MAIASEIYKSLREEIILGHLMPGERLAEVTISERFSCSRSPVREALSRLAREGFLELLPNKGAVVTKISAQEVYDYYALLKVLEGTAVEWSGPRLTADDLNRLEEINNAMRVITPNSRTAIEDWVALNQSFHDMFRQHCGNLKMDWLVEEVRARITRSLYTSLMVPVFDEYVSDHDLMIKKLRQGQHRQARIIMEGHITRAQKVLDQFFLRTNSGRRGNIDGDDRSSPQER
ncbi:MAG: GntR family transcriptional regulator [Pseudomonadota bacterium]